MKRMLTTLALVTAAAGAPDARQGRGIEQVAWLRGCWEAKTTSGAVEEHWTAPSGGSMVGLSRTVRDGALAAYELIVLRERGDRLVYLAHPSGQPAAEFLSTAVSGDVAIFENPAHDFPQRLGYRRQGASLLAWIEGARDGKTRRVEFPYRRVACPSD